MKNFSIQWRRDDVPKSKRLDPFLVRDASHRGNGWLEYSKVTGQDQTTRELKALRSRYPDITWKQVELA